MTNQTTFKESASEVQIFQNIEQKERFIFVVGALVSRLDFLEQFLTFDIVSKTVVVVN